MARGTQLSELQPVVAQPDSRQYELTVIVDGDHVDDHLRRTVQSLTGALAGMDAEVIVTCPAPWPDAPPGVHVVVFPSAGKGDRFDAAAARARGRLLAFLGSQVEFEPGWARAVVGLFDDPSVQVVGGPVVPEGSRRSERVSAVVLTRYLGGTPSAHNARVLSHREVREVGSSNFVIRASAFRAVGGFQAPAGGNAESVRLCYKVRALLGGRIISDPALALRATAPRAPLPLLEIIAVHGRSRGNMARRLPEAAPLFPYALPSAISVLLLAGLALMAGLSLFTSADSRAVGIAVLGAVGLLVAGLVAYSLPTRHGSGDLADGILAGLLMPVVVFRYGFSFLGGYFGRSREEIRPPRERAPQPRVLIVNWRDVTHPLSGGAESYMHQIARRWVAQGFEVGWLTQRHPGSARNEVIDGIRVHRAGGRVTQYAHAAVVYLFRLRRRYDVIVDCENGIPFFTPFYSRHPKVLVVHHVHQEIFRSQVGRHLRWLGLWLEGSLMPWAYRNAQVVAVSGGTRDDLIGLGFAPGRITVIRNGVDLPDRDPGPRSFTPTILCMGRLKPQKSVDVLLRSLPAVVRQVPDVHLDIVGQGPDRIRLERLAWSSGLAEHVRFHGYVRSEVRDQLASSAWLAICPSSFEGWGVVCMEASARGVPVIASDVPGLREAVRDGETGVLFPYGDVDALADRVISLLRDPGRRDRLGAAGRQWAAQHSWESSATSFASLVRSLWPATVAEASPAPAVAPWQ